MNRGCRMSGSRFQNETGPAPVAGNRCGGFTLVSAIFVLVVLATMAASLVTLAAAQHRAAARDIQALRAYYAARAGIEWAGARAQAGFCPASQSFTLAETALDGFTVAVTCSATSHALGAVAAPYYLAEATARAGQYGDADFVSRRLQSKLLVAP